MASVNKVILVGNLGRDPEMRYMPSGDPVASFSIATTDTWKDKNGQKQEKTEWHNISMFGKLAEIAGEYLKKGSSVYVEGRLETRKYTAKDGTEKQATQVVADRMQMLGGRSSGSNTYEVMDDEASTSADAPRQSAPAKQAPAAKPAGGSNFDDFEDDIPF